MLAESSVRAHSKKLTDRGLFAFPICTQRSERKRRRRGRVMAN
jgi:hypothetical protein